MVFFLVLYVLARRFDPNQEPLNFRAGAWAIPWVGGLTILSILGDSYVGGVSSGPGNTGSGGGYATFLGAKLGLHMRFGWDLIIIGVFSLAVFYFAVNSRLGPEQTVAHAEEAAADAHQEDLDLGVGHPGH